MGKKPDEKTAKPGSGPGGSKPNPGEKDKLGTARTDTLGGPGREDRQGPEGSEKTKGKPELKPQEPSTLEQLDEDIREVLGADPFQESFRPPRRQPSDERPNALGQGLRPPEEEEEEVIPGDPSDLGARARRRRKVLEVDQPPVARRGLLGV